MTDDVTLNFDLDGDLIGQTLDEGTSLTLKLEVSVFLSAAPFFDPSIGGVGDPLNPGIFTGPDHRDSRVEARSQDGSFLAKHVASGFLSDFDLVSESNPISVTFTDVPMNTG